MSEADPIQTNSRLYGYRYQHLIGILRLIDLLNNDIISKVSFEQKIIGEDKFDDTKVYLKNVIHHYQIKSSYVENELKVTDFKNTTKGLHLNDLFKSWKNTTEKFSDKINYFHLYTTKSVSSTNPLFTHMVKLNDDRTIFSENKNDVYKLNPSIFDETKLKDILTEILKDNTKEEVCNFLDSLIVETNQPANPPIDFIPEIAVGELEKLIVNKIEKLGLWESPNFLTSKSIFTTLFDLVNRQSVHTYELSKYDVEDYLDIKKNFDQIKNTIEFNENLYVSTKNTISQLNEKVAQNDGNIVGITGKPGCGKTWLLTKWLHDFKNKFPKIPPIWYYSSISVTDDDDFERRITKQQILKNLVASIQTSYAIKPKEYPYSATFKELQFLINSLGEIGIKEKTSIPIVIDGLDHVHRIRDRALTITADEETVLDLIDELEIPKGVCFIFGTQEGSHLIKLKEKFGVEKFFEIYGFTKNETKLFLDKLEIKKEFLEDRSVQLIQEKTNGLPLLVNYVGKFLKKNKKIEDIEKIPLTNGDVGKYYQYLWKNLENQAYPRVFARYFSLFDFPADVIFLDTINPKDNRDGVELSKCIDPLIFLLRKNNQNEISIFHDSFREFILKETEFNYELQKNYCNKIYDVLNTDFLFENSKSFRHAIKYAYKAESYQEIINKINLEFVDNAMLKLCNKNDLENNILYSIRAANKIQNTPLLINKALLKKYTHNRYDFLGGVPYNQLILKLYPQQIKQILFFEEQLNLSLYDTLWFLANSFKNNYDIPYDEITKLWNDTLNKTIKVKEGYLHDSISLQDYGLILFQQKNIETVVQWIEKNNFSIDEVVLIFKQIFPHAKLEDFGEINNFENKLPSYSNILLLHIYNYYGKTSEFQAQFIKFIHNYNEEYLIEFGLFLKNSKIGKNELMPLLKEIVVEYPQQREINLNIIKNFETQIILNSYCENEEKLNEYKTNLEFEQIKIFYYILELIYQYSKYSCIDDSKITTNDIKLIYDSLLKFLNFYDDRMFDEPGYQDQNFWAYFSNIIKNIIKLILTKGDKNIIDEFIENIPKFNSKWMFTSLTEDKIKLIVIKYLQDDIHKQNLIKNFNTSIDIGDTQSMISTCLDKASFFQKIDRTSDSINFFRQSILLSFTYGHHRDSIIRELQMISKNIEDKEYLKRTKNILDLTEYFEWVSDGDDSFIPGEIIEDTMKIHAEAGIKIGLQYDVDSFRFDETTSNFAEYAKNSLILLRYYIIKTRIIHKSSARYDSNAGFEIRIGLIREAIDKNQINIAELLLNDLRVELVRDFPERHRSFETDFNEIAEKINVEKIRLNISRDTEPRQNEHKDIDFKDLSPNELIKLFEEYYGWSWGYSKFTDQVIKLAFEKDSDLTNKLVNDSITNRCINNYYESEGIVHRYAQYLQITNQNKELKKYFICINTFVKQLFRKRQITPKHSFKFLSEFNDVSNDILAGCELLVHRLNSHDTEVQRRTFVSIVTCLLNNIEGLEDYCISKITSDKTDSNMKSKLSKIIESYAIQSKNTSTKIIDCANYLINTNDFRLVTSGQNILKVGE